ncbi:MAG TPA: hypothetical protein VNE71_10945 [Myxococcota bacterium]|nr:hypothetical protein [Myxococcota bacterium]
MRYLPSVPTRAFAGLALLAVAAAACTPAPKRDAHWVTASGAPADREVMGAAIKTCEPTIPQRTRPGVFKGSVQWGVAMLDCLREAGYVLIYDDPSKISPDPN